jgi:hypothetical protein
LCSGSTNESTFLPKLIGQVWGGADLIHNPANEIYGSVTAIENAAYRSGHVASCPDDPTTACQVDNLLTEHDAGTMPRGKCDELH